MGRIGAGIVVMTALVLLFQNCGKAGFENQEMLEDLSTAQTVDPKFALPFPYEISINQLAHMTCPVIDPNSGTGAFAWKVGAFDNPPDSLTSRLNIRPSGLQLSSQFQTEWAQVAKNYHPNIQKSKLKESLKTLPSLADAQLQMSFEKRISHARI